MVAQAQAQGQAKWPDPTPLSQPPAVEIFPLDVLPEQLHQLALDVADAMNCPADFAAVPMLALAGAAIGASHALQIKQGHRQRPIINAAIIGDPGSGKSPALAAC
jgi:hypothetical protein